METFGTRIFDSTIIKIIIVINYYKHEGYFLMTILIFSFIEIEVLLYHGYIWNTYMYLCLRVIWL